MESILSLRSKRIALLGLFATGFACFCIFAFVRNGLITLSTCNYIVFFCIILSVICTLYSFYLEIHLMDEDIKRLNFYVSIVFTLCVIIAHFSWIYYLYWDFDHTTFVYPKDQILTKWDFFYFSTVTIATVGYGDIYPNIQALRLFVTLEIITGIILLIIMVSNSEYLISHTKLKNGNRYPIRHHLRKNL